MTCANDVCAQSKAAHCEPCMESPAVHIQMEHWQVQDKGWFTVEDIAKILGYCARCMSYVCFYIYVRVPERRFTCILFSIFNPAHVKFPPLEVFGIKTKRTRSLQDAYERFADEVMFLTFAPKTSPLPPEFSTGAQQSSWVKTVTSCGPGKQWKRGINNHIL